MPDHLHDVQFFSQAAPLLFQDHDAIIQTLDRKSTSNSKEGQFDIFLTKEAFIPTVLDWEGRPIIFAPGHPDIAAYNANPELELRRIGGREVGFVTNPTIILEGHPRLEAALKLSDREVEKLYKEGKLSLSSGFVGPHNGNRLTGTVTPHHVLVFKETTEITPGDKGSMILNQNIQFKLQEHPEIKNAPVEDLIEAYELLKAEAMWMNATGEWDLTEETFQEGKTFKRSKDSFDTAGEAWEAIAAETGLTVSDVKGTEHTLTEWVFFV